MECTVCDFCGKVIEKPSVYEVYFVHYAKIHPNAPKQGSDKKYDFCSLQHLIKHLEGIYK